MTMHNCTPSVPLNANSHYVPWTLFRSMALVCALTMVSVCAAGILGNMLSIFVFLQPHFRCLSINVLLTALSVADLCLLIMAVPVCSSATWLAVIPHSMFLDRVYTYSVLYLYPIIVTCQCCSIWLLMLITYERWLAVCRPLLVTAYCTRNRAIVATVLLFVLSLSYNVSRFWDYTLDENCTIQPLLKANLNYVMWHGTVGFLSLGYVLPLVVLCAFNLAIGKEIVDSDKRLSRLTRNQRGDRRTAKMLLSVVVAFVCCYALSFAIFLIELAQPRWLVSEIGLFFGDLNNILVMVNSASSAYFYFQYSTRYRRTLAFFSKKFLCPKKLLVNEQDDLFRQIYSFSQLSPLSRKRRTLSTAHNEFLLMPPRDKEKARHRRSSSISTLEPAQQSPVLTRIKQNASRERRSQSEPDTLNPPSNELTLPLLAKAIEERAAEKPKHSKHLTPSGTVIDLAKPKKRRRKLIFKFPFKKMTSFRTATEETSLPGIRVRLASSSLIHNGDSFVDL